MRYAARVEYFGASYCGWQIQPDSPSVQEEINRAFSIVLRQDIHVTGAGRTDAGVHALSSAFHFDTEVEFPIEKIERGVNALLPRDISIFSLKPVSDSFNSRFSAKSREYRYYLSRKRHPLLDGRLTVLKKDLNWDLVAESLKQIEGTHCFSSFCASGCYTDNHLCTIYSTELVNSYDDIWEIRIRGNRFLYKMVRTIVGTLIAIGEGREKRTMSDILKLEQRDAAGSTAPPQGLVFFYVGYDGEL